MAYHYVSGARDQSFLMPVNMHDWLDEGHLAWFVLDVVEKVDTSAFHRLHPNDGVGRPAYDPDMMLGLLFYAYVNGLRSSRRIEAACRTDAAFKVISGGLSPDHATIARFIVNQQDPIKAVFVEVLRLCVAAGLVSAESIAIDGTKMAANAAIDQNRKAEWIRTEVARILSEAITTDTAEEAEAPLLDLGISPAQISTKSARLARLEAALAQIEAEDAAAKEEADRQAQKASQAAAEGRKLGGPKPKDPRAALTRAEADHTAALVAAEARTARRAGLEARAAKEGRKLAGRPPGADDGVAKAAEALEAAKLAAAQAPPPEPRVANITDPDSRMMKTKNGFIQGYNCQAVSNHNQIVIAYGVTQEANDSRQYVPMVETALVNLVAVGVTDPVGVVLADAGYWSEDNATADGPDRLIATTKDWKQRKAARELGTTAGPPPEDASVLEAMEHRLRTPEGTAAYAMRSHTIEPVFANGKENRGIRRFRRRGLDPSESEWSLINTVHNLGKLFTHQANTAIAVT
jgi:transposase